MTQETILKGMAGGLWYDAYACWAEENGESFSGCEITEVCPEPNHQAQYLAQTFLEALERLNGCGVEELLKRAHQADCERAGRELAEYEERDFNLFGHYLVMQALGHGVSWSDDHAEFEVKLPQCETSVMGDYPKEPEFWGYVSWGIDK